MKLIQFEVYLNSPPFLQSSKTISGEESSNSKYNIMINFSFKFISGEKFKKKNCEKFLSKFSPVHIDFFFFIYKFCEFFFL